jgi:hypothetical protein
MPLNTRTRLLEDAMDSDKQYHYNFVLTASKNIARLAQW